jgi:hypothetical protein
MKFIFHIFIIFKQACNHEFNQTFLWQSYVFYSIHVFTYSIVSINVLIVKI